MLCYAKESLSIVQLVKCKDQVTPARVKGIVVEDKNSARRIFSQILPSFPHAAKQRICQLAKAKKVLRPLNASTTPVTK